MNIAEVLAALEPDRIREELDDDLSFVLEDAWNKAARSVGSTATFDIQNPLVVEFLAENRIKAEGITRTLQERVGTQLIEGVMSGEGIDQIRRRVGNAWPEISENRAETIARTEITRAQSFGNVQAYEASGVVDGLEWSAALINTRPSHLVLNGQTRQLGEDFTSGLGGKAQYPGGFGVAADDVNCMCAIIPTVISDSLDVDGKQRYRIDSEADKRRYQAEMHAAMKAVIDTFLPEILRRIK